MITTSGKNILAKYLIGQAPSYASHIAVGCGSKPVNNIFIDISNKQLSSNIAIITTAQSHEFIVGQTVIISGVDITFNGTYTIRQVISPTIFTYNRVANNVASTAVSPVGKAYIDFSEKKTLDFEMIRIPIVSRGYVNEAGVPKIVLTAEMPTTERYEISEVGVYSSGTNPSAGLADSRPIYVFSQGESWKYVGTGAEAEILQISEELSASHSTNGTTDDINTIASNRPPVFSTNADNKTLSISERIIRQEIPRYFNNVIMMRGDDTTLSNFSTTVTGITATTATLVYTTAANHGLRVGDTVTVTGVNPVVHNIVNEIVTAVTATTFTVANIPAATTAYVSGGTVTTQHITIPDGAHHIRLTGNRVDLSKNLPKDQLKLAFSIINTNATSSDLPNGAKIVVRFENTDGNYASFEVNIKGENAYDGTSTSNLSGTFNTIDSLPGKIFTASANGEIVLASGTAAVGKTIKVSGQTIPSQNGYYTIIQVGTASLPWILIQDNSIRQNFQTNRYIVSTKELQNLNTTTGFSWNNVSLVKIYSSVTASSSPSSNGSASSSYYIGLDAMRLENVSSINPLYGMTGYSVIRSANAKTIVKLSNTTNLVEFRFALNVGSI